MLFKSEMLKTLLLFFLVRMFWVVTRSLRSNIYPMDLLKGLNLAQWLRDILKLFVLTILRLSP